MKIMVVSLCFLVTIFMISPAHAQVAAGCGVAGAGCSSWMEKGDAAPDAGMWFNEPAAKRILTELDERDQALAEVKVLKELTATDQATIIALQELLKVKEQLLLARQEETALYKKRAEALESQTAPGFFARLGKTIKVGGAASAGALIGSTLGPLGTVIGAVAGVLVGELF